MIEGLHLPQSTEHDPDLVGLRQPRSLGLAGIANWLAEGIARSVRARMFRIRFLTAIAQYSPPPPSHSGRRAADIVSTPYLAFE